MRKSCFPIPEGLFVQCTLIGLVLVALLLRAACCIQHAELGWQLQFDAGYYVTLAANMRHGVYSLFHPMDIPDTTRMPGYPFIIFLLGGGIWPVLVMQVMVSALKVPLVYRLARLADVKVPYALVAAALMALEPVDGVLAGHVLTETFFSTLLLAAIFLLFHKGGWWPLLGSAVLFAAATWIRPNALFVMLLASMLGVLLLRRKVLQAAFQVGLVLLLVLPWVLRNQRITGRTVLSDSGPVAAAYFHIPQVFATAGNPRAPHYRAELDARALATDWTDQRAASAFFVELRRDIRRALRDHPLAWGWVQLKESAGIYLAPGRGHVRSLFAEMPLVAACLQGVSLLFSLLLLAAPVVWFLARRELPAPLWLLLALAAAVILSAGISTADARFKNPAMPLLVIGLAWAIERTVAWGSARCGHQGS